MTGILWALAAITPASAGSGPWVIGAGQGSVFLGVESQRLTRLAIQVDGERDVIDVGEGLTGIGAKAIGTLGLSDRVEIEATVPWWRVRANRDDSQLCADLGLEACALTTTVGVLQLRGKVVLLDELFGPPFTVTLGAVGRFGDFTAPTRARITNAGEGTVDMGPLLSIGRSAVLGEQGVFSTWIESQFVYRLPNTRSYPGEGGDTRAPGPEWINSGELLVGPNRVVAFGPTVTSLWRPLGLDWGELDLGDIDRLGALKVFSVRAGGTLLVRGEGGAAATLTVLGTVRAVNNPTDVWGVSFGVNMLARRRGDPDE